MRAPIIFIFVIILLPGCSNKDSSKAPGTNIHVKEEQAGQHRHAAEAVRYTCPMHPQVVQHERGKCPICGMELVPVSKTDDASKDLMLSESQIRLANITTQPVTKRKLGQTIAVNGQLKANEEKTEVISSRAAGRIERLFVKETGEAIKQGQPLYVLYSEELLTLQQEYLLAREQNQLLGQSNPRYRSFLEAAERKLVLYGLTRSQISRLNRNSLQPRTTFLAPASGIVTQINAAEGQYVSEGAPLYKTESLTSLWVEAELYADETSFVRTGDDVTVKLSGRAEPIEARVTFLSPEFRNNSQVTILRASIPNRDEILKPGQFAQVFLTRSARQAIALPADAVIRDERGSHVYLRAGENTFTPQRVTTGLESFDIVEITEGISEGDTVAVTGAYLLYSEMILKKGMDPLGVE